MEILRKLKVTTLVEDWFLSNSLMISQFQIHGVNNVVNILDRKKDILKEN